MSPRWGLDTKTDWLTDRQLQYDFDLELSVQLWSVNERTTEAEEVTDS
jgi:hypothetical protein